MRDAIRALRPRYVLIENVPGLGTKMGARPGESALGTVIADLAEAGYVGSYFRLRASDVGAPHKRERIFIVAANTECDSQRWPQSGEVSGETGARISEGKKRERVRADSRDGSTTSPDTGSERLDRARGGDEEGTPEEGDGRFGLARPQALAADADSGGRTFVRITETPGIEGTSGNVIDGRGGEGETAPHSNRERRAEFGRPVAAETKLASADRDSTGVDWGRYRAAIERWATVIGREPPRPTDDRGRLNPAFSAWMMGLPPGWTDEENRTQQLRMIGNAVVTKVGEEVGLILKERI